LKITNIFYELLEWLRRIREGQCTPWHSIFGIQLRHSVLILSKHQMLPLFVAIHLQRFSTALWQPSQHHCTPGRTTEKVLLCA